MQSNIKKTRGSVIYIEVMGYDHNNKYRPNFEETIAIYQWMNTSKSQFTLITTSCTKDSHTNVARSKQVHSSALGKQSPFKHQNLVVPIKCILKV